jgi:hypothetical protein
LPRSKEGYKYVLVLVCVFSSFTILRPLKNKGAVGVAEALWHLFCDFGVPKIIQNDNEAVLVGEVIAKLIELHGAEHRTIAAYNPRANGAVERRVGTTSVTLHKLLSGVGGDWPTLLPFVQLAINNKHSASINAKPFEVFFNRRLNDFATYAAFPSDRPLDRDAWVAHQRFVRDQLFPDLADEVAQKRRKTCADFDRKHRQAGPLEPGTVVMLRDPVRQGKNDPPWIGPYRVASRAGTSTYYLRDEPGNLLPRKVPLDQLKVLPLAHLSDVPRPPGQPASDSSAVASEPQNLPSDQYYVDYLMDHKVEAGKNFYLVKWTGFDEEQASWVPAVDIEDSLINKYLAGRRRLPRDRRAPQQAAAGQTRPGAARAPAARGL